MTGPWIAVVVVLWAVVTLVVAVQVGLLVRILPILERVERLRLVEQGPQRGTALPRFHGLTPEGEVLSSSQLLGRSMILLFVSGRCTPCRRLLDDLREHWGTDLESGLLVITDAEAVDELDLPKQAAVLMQHNQAVSQLLRIAATPAAIAVDDRGIVIATATPNTFRQLQEMDEELTGRRPAGRAADRISVN
jgi:MFS superfamily sulfate permease-like transporter